MTIFFIELFEGGVSGGIRKKGCNMHDSEVFQLLKEG